MKIIKSINKEYSTSPKNLAFNLKESLPKGFVSTITKLRYFNPSLKNDGDVFVISVSEQSKTITEREITIIDNELFTANSKRKTDKKKIAQETDNLIKDLSCSLDLAIE